MVVTVTSLSFPMPISKCTFEGFGQNCFKILLIVKGSCGFKNSKSRISYRNFLQKIFTVCFNGIRKTISIFVIKKYRQFAPRSVVVLCISHCQTLAFLGGWSAIHAYQKRDIPVEEMKDDPLTWLEGKNWS